MMGTVSRMNAVPGAVTSVIDASLIGSGEPIGTVKTGIDSCCSLLISPRFGEAGCARRSSGPDRSPVSRMLRPGPVDRRTEIGPPAIGSEIGEPESSTSRG